MGTQPKSLAHIYSQRLYRKIRRYMVSKVPVRPGTATNVRALIEKEFDNYFVELCGRPE